MNLCKERLKKYENPIQPLVQNNPAGKFPGVPVRNVIIAQFSLDS